MVPYLYCLQACFQVFSCKFRYHIKLSNHFQLISKSSNLSNLKQVARWGCGFSLPGDFQNPPGDGAGHPALGIPAEAGIGPDGPRGPFHPQSFCYPVISASPTYPHLYVSTEIVKLPYQGLSWPPREQWPYSPAAVTVFWACSYSNAIGIYFDLI